MIILYKKINNLSTKKPNKEMRFQKNIQYIFAKNYGLNCFLYPVGDILSLFLKQCEK